MPIFYTLVRFVSGLPDLTNDLPETIAKTDWRARKLWESVTVTSVDSVCSCPFWALPGFICTFSIR